MDEAVVAKMNSREVLDKLKRPAKVAKDLAMEKKRTKKAIAKITAAVALQQRSRLGLCQCTCLS